MPLPAIATCSINFRNNNLEQTPAQYDPGDTVELLISFASDGVATDVDAGTLNGQLTLYDGTVVEVSSSILSTGDDGSYSYSYYIDPGSVSTVPGTYAFTVQGAVDGSLVLSSNFFIVNANSAVLPETDTDGIRSQAMLEVGRILRARTKDHNGRTLGKFTSDTSVTEIEVREQVDISHHYISLYIGYDFSDESIFTDEVIAIITSVIALKTACLIELGYFPEQVRSDKSAYKEYNEMLEKLLEKLVEALADMAAGGEIGSADDTGVAQYGFPEDEGGLVGWQSSW